MDREAWRAAIHGVAKSRTRLSDCTELNLRVIGNNLELQLELLAVVVCITPYKNSSSDVLLILPFLSLLFTPFLLDYSGLLNFLLVTLSSSVSLAIPKLAQLFLKSK